MHTIVAAAPSSGEAMRTMLRVARDNGLSVTVTHGQWGLTPEWGFEQVATAILVGYEDDAARAFAGEVKAALKQEAVLLISTDCAVALV
jgi:hypothetical protein